METAPRAHEMMVTICILGYQKLACRLSRTEIIDRKNVHIFINLFLPILNKSSLPHNGCNAGSIRGQVHTPIILNEMDPLVS